jgi:hypothetical protein
MWGKVESFSSSEEEEGPSEGDPTFVGPLTMDLVGLESFFPHRGMSEATSLIDPAKQFTGEGAAGHH